MELLIAIALLVTVLVGSEVVVSHSLNGVTVAKEYSIATGLLNQDMAEAVALPFADLQSGLNTAATCGSPSVNCLTNDKYIVKSGANYVLEVNGSVVPSAASIIPVANTNSSEAPVVPQISTVLPQPGVTYTVRTYPTILSTCTPGTESCVVTVVVLVTWPSPTGGTDRVIGEEGIATP